MTQPNRIHLFQGYGVELEYMIVDKDSLAVKPIADELLKHELGHYGSDFTRESITWSNEMVLHVIELKATQPELNFSALENAFVDEIRSVNAILSNWNARLLPGGCHPAFNPLLETKLWPHESSEVYETYNRIFDCRGHGWSNLQSTHLNLPFYDDEEFARLHAAVRLILPIIPALCASSPIIETKVTGSADTRLKYYKTNQAKIPSITGRVIPEAVFSKRNYLNTIYEKIKADIARYDATGVLNPIWVNARGAVPRFDRGSIELRLMDSQECPAAEMAILSLLIETIKAIVREVFCDFETQMKCRTEMLVPVLDRTIEQAERAVLVDQAYLQLFGLQKSEVLAGEVWKHIFDRLIYRGNDSLDKWKPELDILFSEGSLATRIHKALASANTWVPVYRHLADCLAQNKLYIP
ncbi:glutamate-cysteine ligase family protein [Oscillatoria amoena NRMC-F 0135]|nr:glutamate-cysteine ligase family protein [Oscillatoria amoena NRMC-F 0135]